MEHGRKAARRLRSVDRFFVCVENVQFGVAAYGETRSCTGGNVSEARTSNATTRQDRAASACPDSRYNSELVTRFINKLMERGKKGLAERIVYDAFEIIQSAPAATRSKCSSRRCTTPRRSSRSSRAASVARPTRCRSRSKGRAASRWRFAGC